jgi:Ca-activated chloride channel family protein
MTSAHLTLADPYLLLVAVLIPLPFLVKRKTFIGYSNLNLLKKTLGSNFWVKLPTVLFLLAIAFLLVALARPQKHQYEEFKQLEARDIILVMDLSYSMEMGLDGESRKRKIDIAREAAREFVKKQEGSRIALIVFGDEAYGSWPLTTDLNIIDEKLQNIGSRFHGGTNFEKPFKTAFQHFEQLGQSQSKVLIFLSDGDAPIPPQAKAEIVQNLIHQGIRFYLMGIQLTNARDMLDIVKNVGGKFIDIQKEAEFSQGFDEINRLEQSAITVEKTEIKSVEFYAVFTLVGLILLLLAEILRNTLMMEFP